MTEDSFVCGDVIVTLSPYPLTSLQKQFVAEAKSLGLKVDWDYSGRFMYGEQCPSVDVDKLSDFPHGESKYCTDNMGLGYVYYCPKNMKKSAGNFQRG